MTKHMYDREAMNAFFLHHTCSAVQSSFALKEKSNKLNE